MEFSTTRDLIEHFDAIETWRSIEGHPNYEVSSWGRVSGPRSVLLAQSVTNGYHHVSLSTNGKTVTMRVARMVALAFLGPPPFDGAHAAHNDGDTSNNRISNIRWATATDNQADINRHGHRVRGSLVHGSRLTEHQIPDIRARAQRGERYQDIADDYGISISTISLIKLGKVWRHV